MSTVMIRAELGDALASILDPKQYQIVTNVGTVDRLAKNLVQIEVSAFEPAPQARGARLVTCTVHTATKLSGVTKSAEDAADAIAFEVFAALESLTWANPTRAEKTVYKDNHLGYDITTEILTTRS